MIYLDHAATTPIHFTVLEAMLPYFSEQFGNPSSPHTAGRRAHHALEQARRTIARLLNAQPNEILWTSGGTESDNMALRGLALRRRVQTGANCIVISPLEHHAVLHTAEALRDQDGFTLQQLSANQQGLIDLAEVEQVLGNGSEIAVCSVMLANNEIGVIQPVAEIGALCRARGVPFHTDAVQAAGKLPLDVRALQVDALSVSAHKFYGPKGVGFLYLRNGTPFQPIQTGGGQERNRRAGTENVPAIVGLAKAFEMAEGERQAESARLSILRDQLIGGILEEIEGAYLTGDRQQRVCNIASFVIPGIEAEALLIALDLAGIAASSGSACTSASMRPSHVLEAIGVPREEAASGLRLSLGRSNTAAEMDRVLEVLTEVVVRLSV